MNVSDTFKFCASKLHCLHSGTKHIPAFIGKGNMKKITSLAKEKNIGGLQRNM